MGGGKFIPPDILGHQAAKFSHIFTKSSAYLHIGLLSWLLLSVGAHMLACTHRTPKRARSTNQCKKKNFINPGYIYIKSTSLMSTVARYIFFILSCIFWPPGANKGQKCPKNHTFSM